MPRRRRRGLDRAFGISLALSLCLHAVGLYFLSHISFPKPTSHIFMLTESGEEALEMEIGSYFESVESVRRIPEVEERRVPPERRDPEPDSKSDVTDLLENEASRLDMPKPAAAERVAADAAAPVLEREAIEPARDMPEPEAREPEPPPPLLAAVPDPRLPAGEVREERYAYERPPWAEPTQEQQHAPPGQLPDLLFPVTTERLSAETRPDAPEKREAAAVREDILPALRDLPLPELAEAPDGRNEQGEAEVSEMRYREEPSPLPIVTEQPASAIPQAHPEPLPALASPASPEAMATEPPDKRPIRKTVAAVLPEQEPATRDMPAGNAPASGSASAVPAARDGTKTIDEERFDAKRDGEVGGGAAGGLSRFHETREAGALEMASAIPSERVMSDVDIEPDRLNLPRNRREPTGDQPPLRDPAEERPQPQSAASALGGEQRKMGVRQQAVRLGTAPKHPKNSRERGEEGVVIVRAMIDASGRCLSAYVLSSSGYRDLDQAALNETLKSDFQPASENGVNISVEDDFEFYFELLSPGWPFQHRKAR